MSWNSWQNKIGGEGADKNYQFKTIITALTLEGTDYKVKTPSTPENLQLSHLLFPGIFQGLGINALMER